MQGDHRSRHRRRADHGGQGHTGSLDRPRKNDGSDDVADEGSFARLANEAQSIGAVCMISIRQALTFRTGPPPRCRSQTRGHCAFERSRRWLQIVAKVPPHPCQVLVPIAGEGRGVEHGRVAPGHVTVDLDGLHVQQTVAQGVALRLAPGKLFEPVNQQTGVLTH